MTKSLSELFTMLKTAEVEIKKEHVVLMVNKMMDFKKSDNTTRNLLIYDPIYSSQNRRSL